MYSGMADVAALTGDASYVKAIDTIWTNTVGKKLAQRRVACAPGALDGNER